MGTISCPLTHCLPRGCMFLLLSVQLKIAPEAHFWAEGCRVSPPDNVERDEELLVEVRVGAVHEGVEVVGEKRKKKGKKGKVEKGKGKAPLEGMEDDEEEEPLGFVGVDSAFVETEEKLVTKVVRKESVWCTQVLYCAVQ